MREVLGSSPGRAMCFFLPCDIWWPVWVCARAASSKGTVSLVHAWFREDSETNLIKQGEIVTGRPCGSVVQWSECWLGMREVLGSSPGWAMCFFLPFDAYANNKGAALDYHLDVSPVNNSDSDARIFLSCIVKMVKLAKFRCRKTSARFENNQELFFYFYFRNEPIENLH